MATSEAPTVLSMGGFPFTPLEILEIGVIMILALPFIVIGIAASCIVHLLQYPLRDLGYTQKLTPVRASRSEYAVVTGASKGLGRDVALKLARDGWSLVIAARNPDLLADLKRSIEDLYGKDCKVIPVACDLGSDGGRRTLENVVKDLPITLVVLNAGCAYTRDLVNVSEQKMRDMLGINVEQQTYLSHYFLTQHFVPGGRGRLCIVSSIVAYSLGSANSLYFSAKSYLSQFGRSLAHECRSLGCGVLTIQPGAMADTNFSSAGDCENSAIFKLPGAQMSSADVAEELVRRLQADDASEATGCHTVGILNKILVAGGPYLSDNLAGFVARFVLLGPDTKCVRSFTARESKLVDRCR